MISVSSKFQYNSTKAVGGVCKTKSPAFCTQIERLTNRRMDRQSDFSIPPKALLWGYNKLTHDCIAMSYKWLLHLVTQLGSLYKINLLKTLWKKEKMLVTSIFSFSHNVFFFIQHNNPKLSYITYVACNYFHLVQSKILSLGKELRLVGCIGV